MGEPVQGAFKGIRFRFGCQFQASPVFPHKPRPFLIDTPVRTGLCIVPVHKPDSHVLTGHGWRKRHAHFSAGFQSGSLPLRPQWEYRAFCTAHSPFHKCRSTPHFGGSRYTGCSPYILFPHAVPVRRCGSF